MILILDQIHSVCVRIDFCFVMNNKKGREENEIKSDRQRQRERESKQEVINITEEKIY